jgi:hypothetical protein
MKYCLLCLTLFLLVSVARAQEDAVTIHIKLIDGRTGKPMKNQQVGLEDRAGYRDISVRTNEVGIASLKISKNTTILTHNTEDYVNCGDEAGGLVRNDFKVSQIVSTGIAQPISQPNLCKTTSAVAEPGEIVLFVRPWRTGEKI